MLIRFLISFFLLASLSQALTIPDPSKTTIASGDAHSLTIDSDGYLYGCLGHGDVYAFGDGDGDGTLGYGNILGQPSPNKV